MYNWSISLMPPIVLDNLFGQRRFQGGGGYLAQLAPPPTDEIYGFQGFFRSQPGKKEK